MQNLLNIFPESLEYINAENTNNITKLLESATKATEKAVYNKNQNNSLEH